MKQVQSSLAFFLLALGTSACMGQTESSTKSSGCSQAVTSASNDYNSDTAERKKALADRSRYEELVAKKNPSPADRRELANLKGKVVREVDGETQYIDLPDANVSQPDLSACADYSDGLGEAKDSNDAIKSKFGDVGDTSDDTSIMNKKKTEDVKSVLDSEKNSADNDSDWKFVKSPKEAPSVDGIIDEGLSGSNNSRSNVGSGNEGLGMPQNSSGRDVLGR